MRKQLLKRRKWFSRTDWTIRLLNLPVSTEPPAARGLVMVQIDGLSQKEFHHAVDHGLMPFLKRLFLREHYAVHPFYSGLPSNTPAVQGELFYGLKGVVPAFSFIDKETQRVVKMYSPGAAAEMERRLKPQGPPLLEGGSAYSEIFTGGAAEAHFCASKLGWDGLMRAVHPAVFPFLFLLHLDVFLWVAVLAAAELVLALISSVYGAFKGKVFRKELEFVVTRIGSVILLRELVVRGAQIDIARGLPIVHMNFVGYDDHAHRRGARSFFARWPLRGVDLAIASVWRAAQSSKRRDYDVWIYSDHGQEVTQAYRLATGMTLQEAVKRFCEGPLCGVGPDNSGESEYPYRNARAQEPPQTQRIEVTAMGNVAHMYPPPQTSPEQLDQFAQALVRQGRIPAIAVNGPAGAVRFWTEEGILRLPGDAERLFGVDHPFLEDVTEDLLALCRHPSSGALVLFGWKAGREPMSFALEGGAHAGFGPEETNAFALLPMDAPLPMRTKPYLRPLDLREAVLKHLGRSPAGAAGPAVPKPRPKQHVRVMTYNVHRCVGLDGKASPERIARVIARHEPDIIALQELDAGHERTHRVHQAERIAQLLGMSYHFHSVIAVAEEQYGNAILSRYPLRLMRAAQLPQLGNMKYLEPRGALWVAVDIGGVALQVINCHLSIWPYERLVQAGELVGASWLSDTLCLPPVVLCGDFNAMPRTGAYRRIARVLRDAQRADKKARVHRTWSSRYPVSRIDHVFTSPDIRIEKIAVPRTALDQVASDHLPLMVEMKLPL